MMKNIKIGIASGKDVDNNQAQMLAAKLGLPLVEPQSFSSQYDYLLLATCDHLELRQNSKSKVSPIMIDFLSKELRNRLRSLNKKNELIAKAVGLGRIKKAITILDATAGFGTDAFILASLGCKVVMLERSPIIYCLLVDALQRLKNCAYPQAGSMQAYQIDACYYLALVVRGVYDKPEVIYLDPIYPQDERTALNKRAMRILRDLVGDDLDADQLLDLSLKSAVKRVVVKRPKLASYLGGVKPTLQFFGSSSRYDIYLVN